MSENMPNLRNTAARRERRERELNPAKYPGRKIIAPHSRKKPFGICDVFRHEAVHNGSLSEEWNSARSTSSLTPHYLDVDTGDQPTYVHDAEHDSLVEYDPTALNDASYKFREQLEAYEQVHALSAFALSSSVPEHDIEGNRKVIEDWLDLGLLAGKQENIVDAPCPMEEIVSTSSVPAVVTNKETLRTPDVKQEPEPLAPLSDWVMSM